MKVIILSLIFVLAYSNWSHTQKRKSHCMDNWIDDFEVSGVGLDLFNPVFTDRLTSDGPWRGINVLFGPIIFSMAHGRISIYESLNPYYQL